MNLVSAMKRLFLIALKVLSGAIFGLVLFIFLDLAMWYFPPERGWAPWKWEQSGPVAIGNNYSIELLTRTAHPFLAEYDQRLIIYGGTERVGKKLATIDLHTNTGGRTSVEVYADGRETIYLKDRFGTHAIDLDTLTVTMLFKADLSAESSFIGVFSGESYPLKFIPAAIWKSRAMLSIRDKLPN